MIPYKIKNLGSLPGGKSCSPSAINARGEVVGKADSGANWSQAFLWTDAGGMTALPGLPGTTHSWANDINDHGEIVGSCIVGGTSYAVHWVAGIPYSLDADADAQSINNKGEMAGTKYNGANTFACSWKGGVIQLLDLAKYHGSSQNAQCNGLAIIDSGEVFGTILNDRPFPPPFNEYEAALRWNNAGQVHELDYPDNLDRIGMNGRDSGLWSANNFGFAVGSIFYGSTQANEVFKPFFWSPYGKGLLGTSPKQMGDANHINSIGQVVGYLDDGTGQRAMIWNGPVVTDLNDLISPFSEWLLTYPTCINDSGKIVGNGQFLGEYMGFIMSPVYREINLSPVYWQIMFGVLGDSGGIQLVGPGGGGPGPSADTLSALLHYIPHELRADIREILISQKNIDEEGLKNRGF